MSEPWASGESLADSAIRAKEQAVAEHMRLHYAAVTAEQVELRNLADWNAKCDAAHAAVLESARKLVGLSADSAKAVPE